MKKFNLLAVILPLTLLFTSFTFAQGSADSSFGDDSKEEKLLELEIEGVYEYGYNDSYLIRLIEKKGDGEWSLTMVVGGCEATGIARSMNDVEFSRPLTYDLFNSVFEKSSLKLKHIVITKLEGGTYYAVLVLDDDGKTIEIDARPSDSMNIAMKADVPIFATSTVWIDAREKFE